jgi:hypothetical protein
MCQVGTCAQRATAVFVFRERSRKRQPATSTSAPAVPGTGGVGEERVSLLGLSVPLAA